MPLTYDPPLAAGLSANPVHKSDLEAWFGQIAQDAAARAEQIIAEAQARAEAIQAEAEARAAGLTAANEAREQGDAALATAIEEEVQARVQSILAETEARVAALTAETQARIAGIQAEAEARAAGLTAANEAREQGDAALAESIETEEQARIAALTAEAQARVQAIDAEAQARITGLTDANAARLAGDTALGVAIGEEAQTRQAAIRDGALIRLQGVTGVQEISASLPAGLQDVAVVNGAILILSPVGNSTGPNPTLTLGSVTRTILDVDGGELPAGALRQARPVQLRVQSASTLRLVTTGVSRAEHEAKAEQAALAAEVAAREAGLSLKADQTALDAEASARQEAVVQERTERIAGDERWPGAIDPFGLGWQHYQHNQIGQIPSYKDVDGVTWEWSISEGAYVSVMSERQARVAADTALQIALDDEAVARVAGDERWPSILDYIGQGWRHMHVNAAGQVVAYIDAAGQMHVWSTSAAEYVSTGAGGWQAAVAALAGDLVSETEARQSADANLQAQINAISVGEAMPLYNEPVTWPQKEAIGAMRGAVLKAVGYAPTEPTPPVQPSGTGKPFWVQDSVEYGRYVSQQIPKITITLDGRWLYRAEYGTYRGTDGEILPAGSHGETIPCWVRISRFDLTIPGSLDQHPEYVASVVGSWPDAYNRGVIDPMLEILHNGDLLVCVPTVGGGTRSAWAAIITSPEAATIAEAQLGPWCWIGHGFVGRPRWHGGEVRMTVNQPGASGWSEYIRLKITGRVVERDLLATVPMPADPSIVNYQEASVIPYDMRKVLYTMRTTQGPYQSISIDGGYTWPAPTPMADAFDWAGRNTLADMARSPSGLLLWGHNHSTIARRNMAIAVSKDDGASWPIWHILDPRLAGNTSYPSMAFGRLPDGSYDGWVYLAYDSGRGRIEDPDRPGKYINWLIIAKVWEASLLTETPVFTIHQLDDTIYG